MILICNGLAILPKVYGVCWFWFSLVYLLATRHTQGCPRTRGVILSCTGKIEWCSPITKENKAPTLCNIPGMYCPVPFYVHFHCIINHRSLHIPGDDDNNDTYRLYMIPILRSESGAWIITWQWYITNFHILQYQRHKPYTKNPIIWWMV